jgi:lipoprotein-anchoring transpeptidase ErfK/SrfK
MKNLSAALATIIVCLLTGSAVVLATGKENAIAMSITTSTGSEATGDHSASSSVRRRRLRTKAAGAVVNIPASSSGAASLILPAETGATVWFPDPTVSSGAKAIWIYLGIQEAFLTESGTVVRIYKISSGAPATPTPRGVFKIYKKEELRVSGQAVAYRMPNYMSFTKNSAFGLHGLPYLGKTAESSGYWTEALSHIGTPVSHGCVRFLPEEAVELYKWADRGIPVFIQV